MARTWVAGEVVTAAQLNTNIRDEHAALVAGTVALAAVTLDGPASAPAVAPSGAARLYFDAVTGLVKVSVDGGAYRPLGGGTVWPLGGHPDFQQTSGAFDTIYGREVLQPSYARTGTVHAMARVDGGTGQLRVYNVTDAAVVGTAWDVTNTTVAMVISGELTLAGGTQYRVEAKRGTTWIKVWGAKFVES